MTALSFCALVTPIALSKNSISVPPSFDFVSHDWTWKSPPFLLEVRLLAFAFLK